MLKGAILHEKNKNKDSICACCCGTSGVSTNFVYGNEDSRVLDFTKNGVVKLMSNSGYVGTGFVVDEHTILTAAHCVSVYNTNPTYSSGNSVTKIYCFDGNDDVDKTITNIESIHIPAKYFDTRNDGNDITNDSDYDYAIIKVQDDLSDYMCFYLGTMLDSFRGAVSCSGFPEKMQVNGEERVVNGYDTHAQYTGTGTVRTCSVYTLGYTCDTSPGNSGGPVYFTTAFDNQIYYTVIAIHTNGIGGSYSSFNGATRITPSILQFVYNNPNQ